MYKLTSSEGGASIPYLVKYVPLLVSKGARATAKGQGRGKGGRGYNNYYKLTSSEGGASTPTLSNNYNYKI